MVDWIADYQVLNHAREARRHHGHRAHGGRETRPTRQPVQVRRICAIARRPAAGRKATSSMSTAIATARSTRARSRCASKDPPTAGITIRGNRPVAGLRVVHEPRHDAAPARRAADGNVHRVQERTARGRRRARAQRARADPAHRGDLPLTPRVRIVAAQRHARRPRGARLSPSVPAGSPLVGIVCGGTRPPPRIGRRKRGVPCTASMSHSFVRRAGFTIDRADDRRGRHRASWRRSPIRCTATT